MRSKRPIISVIRGILFIVRLQKATHPLRHPTAKNQTSRNAQQQKMAPNKLKRCESTRSRLPAVRIKYGTKHRNSAPTTLLFRTPTPQIEIKLLQDECNFGSFARMAQPYTLRLEKSSSGGNGNNSKAQINVHTSMAHQLASRLLLQKQPSLDDRRRNVDSPTNDLGKLVRRQGSVESTVDKNKGSTSASAMQPSFPDEHRLVRKIKNSMINLFGALTAVEQNDLDSLKVILSKKCFPLSDTLESGLYSQFPIRLTLLDVALMLDRKQVADLLLKNGACENPQLTSISQRRKIVDDVLEENQKRLQTLYEKAATAKEDEKRAHLLESQLKTVNTMKSVLDNPLIPGPPKKVKVYVTSAHRATIEFNAPEHEPGPSTSVGATNQGCVIIKYKAEWSKDSSFDIVDGTLELTDMTKAKITVDNLIHNESYTFRIAAASMWGFGNYNTASPKQLRISSWEDVDGLPNFRMEQMQKIADLFERVEKYRQSTVWQRVFPNCVEIMNVRKKKTGLRYLFSASSKFVKNVQRGIYLASIIYTEGKVLCTVDDCLPILCIDESLSGISSIATDDMHWLMKLSLCWDQVAYLQESMTGSSCSNSSQLRAKILDVVTSMHNALGVRDIGRIHHTPLTTNGSVFLVSVNLVSETQAVQGLAMRWMRMEKLIRKKYSCPALEFLSAQLFNILNFFESSQIPLDPGLYMGYLRLQSTLNVIRVTVPENVPSVLPFVLVRKNPHVSQEEWEWLRQIDQERPFRSRPSSLQQAFHQQLGKAAAVLINDLDMDTELIQNHRIYKLQVLQLHSDVSFILVMPKAEDVCQVNTVVNVDESSEHFKACTSIPVPVFQMINLFTYQPDFIAAYCRLSIFLDHFIMLMQYEQRQCLLENDSKVYADQLEKLADFQTTLDEIWRSSRWISNIASVAREREKQKSCSLLLTSILEPPTPLPSEESLTARNNNNHTPVQATKSSNSTTFSHLRTTLRRSKALAEGAPPTSLLERSRRHSEKNLRYSLKFDSDSCRPNTGLNGEAIEGNPKSLTNATVERNCVRLLNSPVTSVSSSNSDQTVTPHVEASRQVSVSNSVVRVFVAYECGLESGASVKIRITDLTTAREIVALVVNQMAKLGAAPSTEYVGNYKPTLNFTSLVDDFCLVSVIGGQENKLRADFPIVKLQSPWNKGKLFVRHVNCVSAAVQVILWPIKKMLINLFQWGNEALV
ncbi:ankyrin repeat and fibronectin type-III domain-containing protein 1 [Ditylenchus destructor]|uniref:Ankyrin repeat and fibronectin type-III domain-containing protein 1 n=1 Tax=Ditylenchus destructor TaxID=166010 RepID=A0AAD4R5P3_9BILA|nr:ankyrin repeat and fibronectin type-III domain-containing protein 1 [Ditylenchus destructor]